MIEPLLLAPLLAQGREHHLEGTRELAELVARDRRQQGRRPVREAGGTGIEPARRDRRDRVGEAPQRPCHRVGVADQRAAYRLDRDHRVGIHALRVLAHHIGGVRLADRFQHGPERDLESGRQGLAAAGEHAAVGAEQVELGVRLDQHQIVQPDLKLVGPPGVRLSRIVAELVPAHLPSAPKVHGLVALMEILASRTPARVDAEGRPVLLMNQNRSRWEPLLIRRGLAALARAEALGGAREACALHGVLAACHARARTAEATDWAQIAALYEALAQVAPSPVIELNRAVAVGMAFGPTKGLAIVDALVAEPRLVNYPWPPSVRGELLGKLGRAAEARAEFERAAALTRNERDRELLLARLGVWAAED